MSELMNTTVERKDFRWQLLATVSSLTLLSAVAVVDEARAQDVDKPVVWIELGGQLERMNGAQDPFTAPFENGPGPLDPRPFPLLASNPILAPVGGPLDLSRAFDVRKLPPNSFGGDAKISFEPRGSDWVFSASVRYGRSNGRNSNTYETPNRVPYVLRTDQPDYQHTPYAVRFSNARAKHDESHAVVDFQVGRDVGLGLFGRSSSSVVNAGVRFAQFTLKTSMNIIAVPTIQPYVSRYTGKYDHVKHQKYHTRFQSYLFSAHSTRSFHGVGPSLSWSGSTPFAGNPDATEVTFDWGIDGALLFGRQKTQTDHRTTSYDRYLGVYGKVAARYTRYRHSTAHSRSHSVTVPNLGGFAGLSLKFPNAKVSLGYRADFFFGAMDAGIDTRHDEDMSFHGPFANISIGLGG